MNRGPIAEIDLSALQHNLSILRNITSEKPVIAVVKADAYGHGAVPVAQRLQDAGVAMLAVAFTGEARKLREGGIRVPILVLFDRGDMEDYFAFDLTPVIHDRRTALRLSNEAVSRGCRLPVHLKIDTGMGRVGLSADQAVSDVLSIVELPGVEIAGLMSHFSEADLADRSYAEKQIGIFQKIRQELSGRIGKAVICHMANSAASLSLPLEGFDAVRPGLLLYGYSPLETQCGLRPLMKLSTKVLAIRNLAAGSPVGYGRTFVTKKPSIIAVVPIGYADGFSRYFSNNGVMLVRGVRVPVVGRVCMDLTMIDVTGVDGAAEGDEVVVLGQQCGETISAAELAGRAGTIPYEILTSLGNMAKKEYIN
ncbi:MAG: alanine racemase [Thermodesulfovibrio sp.]|nr:alanine racemase [Thermodesulfovibrio sp.]